ncbi:MAG: arsenite efflux transporter metallochaperone ArsD [Candidatus Metalachnospira sp.]|nr:arsenite efflux transporter metallochaperone ArsD [Candidatus Metalachnospira sp.]
MKKMKIFEPAMCCETGLCGVGVNPDLLRISAVINTLKNNGIVVDRYNLSNAPMEFVNNKVINAYINAHGPEGLPVVTVDDEIIITGRYPSSEEFTKLLNLPVGILSEQRNAVNVKGARKKSGGCNCKGGCC